MKTRPKIVKVLSGIILLIFWLVWDLGQADKNYQQFPSLQMLSEFPAVQNPPTTVSIVRSNDSTLVHPVSVNDENISYDTIEEMVRRAVQLAGGFESRIESGDMVLIKPNIVDPEPPGSGEVTDVRVVKALIKIIDEIDHGHIEIVVGEGSPRPMDYEMDYQSRFSSPQWDELWDTAGYQELLNDQDLSGVNLRLSNLNGSPPENPWQDLELVDVPGGGDALPQGGQYYIHKDVINADFYISVPVMKIHTPGMTVALKNQIGLAPSTRYGFHKTLGVPQDNYTHKLTHEDPPRYWTDKEIVDLSTLASIDFAVVDAIACLELEKTARRSGGEITNLVRMNTIIASPDPVAADHVAARLMGLNPDDIEHITLAERRGLGTNNPADITIAGASIQETQRRFLKNSSATADYGQSNRIWLLKGPFSTENIDDPINNAFITNESNLAPEPGSEGWSEPVYFTEDRIDLDSYFNANGSQIAYTFTYFNAPITQQAELWLGSDEAMKIWLNGNVVYNYQGFRIFSASKFVSEKVPVEILAGENRLLVKTYQEYGMYHFTLNICEPESNPYYDGNRVWGLNFTPTPTGTGIIDENLSQQPISSRLGNAYPNPFNNNVVIPYELQYPGEITLQIFDINGKVIQTLIQGYESTIGQKQIRWDGTDISGKSVSSGAYFIRLIDPNHKISTQKVMYLK